MNRWIRAFIDANIAASKWFDRTFMPESYCKDGNQDFIAVVAPMYIHHGAKIYDVGGGKQPYLDVERKQSLGAYVVGIDIGQQELDRAPKDAYDETWCADISTVQGKADGDVVVCQALLEHVRDTDRAVASIASLLKPGGKALIFVPSRNAVYARLNLMLPEKLKRSILWSVFPESKHAQGFVSYYNRCTPNDLIAMAKSNGMEVSDAHYYFVSSYFSFLFPLYVAWRVWVVLFRMVAGKQAAETFILILEKLK